MIVLGLDPGSTRIGYGVIDVRGNNFTLLSSGLLRIDAPKKEGRLAAIEKDLEKILKKFRPARAGVEKLFFMKNQKTALAVAETRGVLLNALYKKRVPVFEIAPSEVKSAVAGDGRASKASIAKMIGYFLKLPPKKTVDDVTDAIAIAIAVSSYRS